jgi:hypothetical protein
MCGAEGWGAPRFVPFFALFVDDMLYVLAWLYVAVLGYVLITSCCGFDGSYNDGGNDCSVSWFLMFNPMSRTACEELPVYSECSVLAE